MHAADVIIAPKRPALDAESGEWSLYDHPRVLGYPAERWISRGGYVVISAVEVVTDDGHRESIGPEYHISVSRHGGRVSADEVPKLLRLFGMEGADEDNHGGPAAIARHFWLPVSEKFAGFVCPCKGEEKAVTEGDYVWRPAPAR